MAAIMAQPFNAGNMHYFPTEQQETTFNDPFTPSGYPTTDSQSYSYAPVTSSYRQQFQQSLPRYSLPLAQGKYDVSPTTAANPYNAYWPPTPPLQSNLSPGFYSGAVQPIHHQGPAGLPIGPAPVRSHTYDSAAGLGLSFGDAHSSRQQSFASIGSSIGSSNATFRTSCSELEHSHSDASRASSPTTNDLTQFGYINQHGTWTCNYPGCQSKAVFTRGCDLRKHHKRHTKTFFCSFPGCQQQQSGGFSSKKDLARHEAKHNPGVTCEWDGCERIFSRVDNMRDHVKRIHMRRQARRGSGRHAH